MYVTLLFSNINCFSGIILSRKLHIFVSDKSEKNLSSVIYLHVCSTSLFLTATCRGNHNSVTNFIHVISSCIVSRKSRARHEHLTWEETYRLRGDTRSVGDTLPGFSEENADLPTTALGERDVCGVEKQLSSGQNNFLWYVWSFEWKLLNSSFIGSIFWMLYKVVLTFVCR